MAGGFSYTFPITTHHEGMESGVYGGAKQDEKNDSPQKERQNEIQYT